MQTPSLEHQLTVSLPHNGDCSLLGISPDLTMFVEEVYGDDGWLAQHAIATDGALLASVDEQFGAATNLSPLELPERLIEPRRGWHTMALNFTGARHRGLRGPDRLDDVIQSFTVAEKFALAGMLKLDVPPPLLLGLAESYVLAEASVTPPHLFLICRRLRIAFAFPEEQIDDNGQPYDYDTRVLYAAHFYDTSSDEPPGIVDSLRGLDGANLCRPMDCLIYGDRLVIADGGSDDRQSAVHMWRIPGLKPKLSSQNQLGKHLYG